jgi:hypothetical protein
MNVDLGYSDLNIPVCVETSGCLKELVLRAFQLGFRTVALNTVIDQVLDTCTLPAVIFKALLRTLKKNRKPCLVLACRQAKTGLQDAFILLVYKILFKIL